MSWDVILLRLPQGVRALEALPRDFIALPIGEQLWVKQGISRATFSEDKTQVVEWMTSTCGVLRTTDYVIEIDLGSRTKVLRIDLQVQGSDRSITTVSEIASELGVVAVDRKTEMVVDFDDEVASSRGLERAREQREVEVAVDREMVSQENDEYRATNYADDRRPN